MSSNVGREEVVACRDRLLKLCSAAALSLTTQQRSDRLKSLREIEEEADRSLRSDEAPLLPTQQEAGRTSVTVTAPDIQRVKAPSTANRGASSSRRPSIVYSRRRRGQGDRTASDISGRNVAQHVAAPMGGPGSACKRAYPSKPAPSDISRAVSDIGSAALGLAISAPAAQGVSQAVLLAPLDPSTAAAADAEAALHAPAVRMTKNMRRKEVTAELEAIYIALGLKETQATDDISDTDSGEPESPYDMKVEQQLRQPLQKAPHRMTVDDAYISEAAKIVFRGLPPADFVVPPAVNTQNWNRVDLPSAQDPSKKGKQKIASDMKTPFEREGPFKKLPNSLAELFLTPGGAIMFDVDDEIAEIRRVSRREVMCKLVERYAPDDPATTLRRSYLTWARQQIVVLIDQLEQTEDAARIYAKLASEPSITDGWNERMVGNLQMLMEGREELNRVAVELDIREAHLRAREALVAAREASDGRPLTHSVDAPGQPRTSSHPKQADLDPVSRYLVEKLFKIEATQAEQGSYIRSIAALSSQTLGTTARMSVAFQQDRESGKTKATAARDVRARIFLAAQKTTADAWKGDATAVSGESSRSPSPVESMQWDDGGSGEKPSGKWDFGEEQVVC